MPDYPGGLMQKLNIINGRLKKGTIERSSLTGSIDIMPIPVVVIGREFTIENINPAGAEMLGKKVDSCIGASCSELFKLPLCNTADCPVKKAFAEGVSSDTDVTIKAAGSVNTYRCHTSAVKDNAGAITHAAEYFIDQGRQTLFLNEVRSSLSALSIGNIDGLSINYSQYEGALRKVGKAISIGFVELLKFVLVEQDFIQKIGRGDRNIEHMPYDREKMLGAWIDGVDSINAAVDAINSITAHVEYLVAAAGNGQLAVRGEPDNFKGAWADIVTGINSILDTVITPLNEVSNCLNRQAVNDLTIGITGAYKGDLGRLAEVANMAQHNQVVMVGRLKQVSHDLMESGGQLSQASNQTVQATQQITHASQQVSKGASDQATSLQNTMKAMEQLNNAINSIAGGTEKQTLALNQNIETVHQVSVAIAQISSNTETVSTNARMAMDAAQNGADMVKKTIKGMEDIRSNINLASEKLNELGTRSHEIGKIVETINDIAEQTNLLALNAAIEAARAGEQGRGFAVVADEVRKLAENASTSTKEIAELISGIRAGISQTTQAMKKGNEHIAGGYDLATNAGRSLEDILQKSSETDERVLQMSSSVKHLGAMSNKMVDLSNTVSGIASENITATRDMTIIAGKVSRSIEEVAGVAEENSAATQEVSAATEEISAHMQQVLDLSNNVLKVAGDFQQLVETYKLKEN